MKNNKKGSATAFLIIALLVALAIIAMIIKLNWARFKAETSFAFTMIGIVLAVILLLYLVIRIKISRMKKEKARQKAQKEQAELYWQSLPSHHWFRS